MVFVLDTDVLVAAVRSQSGASNKLLEMLLQGKLQAVASVPLMVEYEAVLRRSHHLAAASMTVQDVMNFLDVIAIRIKPVTISYLWRPTLLDVQDEMVLESAINGAANIITTFNKKHFAGVTSLFGIEVLTPGEILERKLL